MISRLTSKQKWKLAIKLFLMYSPLLFYVNMPQTEHNGASIVYFLPFFILFSLVGLGMYFIWITATDWLQRYLFKRFGLEILLESGWQEIVLTVAISLGLAVLYSLVFQLVMKSVAFLIFPVLQSTNALPKGEPFLPEVMDYVHRANNGFSVAIMLSIFYLIINTRSSQQLKSIQLQTERLEKEAAMSQFEALKNQLSPHFLFNSLSILTSLVHEDADLSEQFVKRLSKAYRYILEQRDMALVSLAVELDFIASYTFLLQMRFEDKFQVVIDVPVDLSAHYCIAPLSLQMLVENAVKHNRMSIQEPLKVRIYLENEYLIVENPIQPRDQPEDSTGVGLHNITNRYSLLTDHKVWYGEQNGSFVVRIPLLT
ncbi:histidine kinase [Dyadobacter chenwenxiniae]|uniref:Histidine kinase n=1 Tax=Dyadobacter chenwenxiniae TaxID=2906456 RepID=A0A9X1PJ70_9BACT|nr:histidine kinase [Dyadobacter chenwenxiniae]MCF0060468.1 histidine kinase [Dyadobacter chenwenxiniae]UON86200.1 histidine kinase [Dyadobacter chenwenxiniae]